MGKKVYDCLKDIILPVVSIFVSGFIAFSAYTVSKEAQKVNSNSGVLRYQIDLSDTNGKKKSNNKAYFGFSS
ncbi:hypothetical protein [Streptococcus cristatus]|uniref:hypothetical protein n=1 Tax=Streptococcus cristatus TaxID=45634 RepID=UPI0028D39655|nr:hypothetical protein [Streptococcus cristatus]